MNVIRHTFRKSAAVGLAFAAGGVLALSGSAQAAEQRASYMGCPSGYVCLYPNASWNGGVPSHSGTGTGRTTSTTSTG